MGKKDRIYQYYNAFGILNNLSCKIIENKEYLQKLIDSR
jgi:hypothetical protein